MWGLKISSVWCVPVLALCVSAPGCERRSAQPPPSRKASIDTSKPKLTMGVLPATNKDSVHDDYAVLIQELAEALGRPVELRVPNSYAAMIKALKSGDIQVGQLSAYAYVRSARDLHSEIIVQQRMAWDTEYRGVFVVKDDASFTQLSDLKGKRFAYVDAESSAGYYYARMRLREAGYNPDKFFSTVTFAGSHKKVIALIEKGVVDAGVISIQSLSESMHLRKIDRTDVIPDDVIVAGKGVSPIDKAALRAYLLKAHAHSRLNIFMNRRGIETYVRADPTVYAGLAKELARVDAEVAH